MFRQILKYVLLSALLSTVGMAQVSLPRINADTLKSKTTAQSVFVDDTLRVKWYIDLDSGSTTIAAPLWGKARIVAFATGGVYVIRPNGAWYRMDSAATGGSGEANTASNAAGAGVGVFKVKSGVDLIFKRLKSLDANLTIADSTDSLAFDFANSPTFAGMTITGLSGTVRATAGVLSATASDTVGLAAALFAKAPKDAPVFTTSVTTPLGAGTVRSSSGGLLSSTASDTVGLAANLFALAPKASPTFTGTVTMPLGTGTVRSSVGGVLSSTASDTVGLAAGLFAKAATATTITIDGTANEVTSSAGAQDLSANRTWIVGLPDDVTIGDDLTVGDSLSSASVRIAGASLSALFNLTSSTTNTNRSTSAQERDTSAFNFRFTETGKPLVDVVGPTATPLFNMDSSGNVGLGIAATYRSAMELKNPRYDSLEGQWISGQGWSAINVDSNKTVSMIEIFKSNTHPTAASQYNAIRIFTADSAVDGGTGLSIYNYGRADNMYMQVSGINSAADNNTPTGLGIDLNNYGGTESSTTFGGYGIQVWDWSVNDRGTNGASPLYIRKVNNLNSQHYAQRIRANRNALIFDVPAGSGFSPTFQLLGILDSAGGSPWIVRSSGDHVFGNSRYIYWTPSAGNQTYIGQNNTTLDIRGGSGGLRMLNNAGAIVNLAVSDPGVVTVAGYVTSDTVYGSASSGGNLFLGSTTHATKGLTYIGPYLNVNDSLGAISTTSTSTATSGTINGLNFSLTANPGAATSSTYRNLFQVQSNASLAYDVTGGVRGVDVRGTHNGTDTMANAFAGLFVAANASSGVVTNLYGVSSSATNTSSGRVTNTYGIYSAISNSNVAGVTTNAYGLYIPTFNRAGTITNSWGVYVQEATANNYFGGSLGIGDASPASALTVGSGDLFQVNSSGKIAEVADIAAEGTFGVPVIVDTVVRAGQTADITATNFSNSGVAGMYVIFCYLQITTAGASGTISVTIAFTDAVGATSTNVINLASTTSTGRVTATPLFVETASGNIAWSSDITVVSGTPAYRLTLVCQKLN